MKPITQADNSDIDNCIKRLYDKDWVVYAKKPLGEPHQVVEYLSRYTQSGHNQQSYKRSKLLKPNRNLLIQRLQQQQRAKANATEYWRILYNVSSSIYSQNILPKYAATNILATKTGKQILKPSLSALKYLHIVQK